MAVIVTVNECFESVIEQENQKPEAQRRSLPTQAEFARAAGVHRQAFHRWLKSPNLNETYFDAIITKMRAYGFDIGINDLVKYVPPDEADSQD
jgi:hypothetical protein